MDLVRAGSNPAECIFKKKFFFAQPGKHGATVSEGDFGSGRLRFETGHRQFDTGHRIGVIYNRPDNPVIIGGVFLYQQPGSKISCPYPRAQKKKKKKKKKKNGRTGSRARVKRITTAYANHYTIRPTPDLHQLLTKTFVYRTCSLCGSMDRAPDF